MFKFLKNQNTITDALKRLYIIIYINGIVEHKENLPKDGKTVQSLY